MAARFSSLSPNPNDALSLIADRLLYPCWALLAVGINVQALSWPMMQDTPILHYTAWLISKGYVPYRDIFEMNLPGAWGIHLLGIRLFGDTIEAVPRLDLTWLTVTLCMLTYALWPFGKRVALTGVLLLTTAYRMGGPMDVLQRDYLMLAPLFLGIGSILRSPQRWYHASLAGLGIGAAALLKPQALGLLPLLSLTQFLQILSPQDSSSDDAKQDTTSPHQPGQMQDTTAVARALLLLPKRASGRDRLLALIGHVLRHLVTSLPLILATWISAGLVVVSCLLLLIQMDAADAFWELWREYLGPLYSHLDGMGMEFPPGAGLYAQSAQEALRTLLFPSRLALLLGGIAGTIVLWKEHLSSDLMAKTSANRTSHSAPFVRTPTPSGVPVHAEVPAHAGVHPRPHLHAHTKDAPSQVALESFPWLPLLLLGFLGYGFLHVVIGVKQWWYHWWPFYGAAIVLISCLSLKRIGSILLPLLGILILLIAVFEKPHQARIDAALSPVLQLTQSLQRRMAHETANDSRIQVLDTVGGGIHAAFRAHLEPATPFIYDFHFFHHIQSPFIQTLRARLMSALMQHPPRYIVVWHESWSHRTSYDSLAQFSELNAFLQSHYSMAEETSAYRLLELKQVKP